MRSLIVRLGYMAGGVVETAVPALCLGCLYFDWVESHVKCYQSSIRQRQVGKSFPLPADHPDGPVVRWIPPSEKRILIRRLLILTCACDDDNTVRGSKKI